MQNKYNEYVPIKLIIIEILYSMNGSMFYFNAFVLIA